MRKKRIKVKVLLLLALWLFIPFFSEAGYGTLTWNANTETDLAGYRVYYGTSARSGNTPPASYTVGPVEVGNVTTYNTPNLDGGATYYFSVVAYDTSGNISNFSSEVNKVIIAGDVNNDRTVNIFDYNEFIGSFGNTDCNNRSNIIGFSPTCRVDIFDYNSLLTDFGRSSS